MIAAYRGLDYTRSFVDIAAGEHVQDDVAGMGVARPKSRAIGFFAIGGRCAAVELTFR
jgi:hypothetical protein